VSSWGEKKRKPDGEKVGGKKAHMVKKEGGKSGDKKTEGTSWVNEKKTIRPAVGRKGPMNQLCSGSCGGVVFTRAKTAIKGSEGEERMD